jgi:hypothetical protein
MLLADQQADNISETPMTDWTVPFFLDPVLPYFMANDRQLVMVNIS